MDNILKLTVGCLGLVGLIVMVVPNSDPLAATKADAEAAVPNVDAGAPPPPPPPPPPTTAAPEEPAAASEFVVDDYDIGNFGMPMVDPTPPAQQNIITQQQQQQQAKNSQIAGQPSIAGADSAGLAGPPPPPPLPGN